MVVDSLMRLVENEITHMVVEENKKQHFFTPERRILPLMCFDDPLVSEVQRHDERPYEIAYGLWTQEMQRLHPHRQAFRKITTKRTTSARNLLKAYEVIAEEILTYHPDNIREMQLNCIHAARIHLTTATDFCPRIYQPSIFVSRGTPGRCTSCAVWVVDSRKAQEAATEVLKALSSLHYGH